MLATVMVHNMENTAMKINNRSVLFSLLIRCHSHKLLCFSPFALLDIFVLYDSVWFGSWFISKWYALRGIEDTFHFCSMTIESSVCHWVICILLHSPHLHHSGSFFVLRITCVLLSCNAMYVDVDSCVVYAVVVTLFSSSFLHEIARDICDGLYTYINKRSSKTSKPLQNFINCPPGSVYPFLSHISLEQQHSDYERCRTVWFLSTFDGLNTYHYDYTHTGTGTGTCVIDAILSIHGWMDERKSNNKREQFIYFLFQSIVNSFDWSRERERDLW